MGNLAFFAAADPFAPGQADWGSASAGPDVTTGQLGQVSVNNGNPKVWHTNHGFFWFAAIAAVTTALVGGSAHLKLGKEQVGIEGGPTKKSKED